MLQIASENGYNRLVLGSCTSRIACHVLTATVKVYVSFVLFPFFFLGVIFVMSCLMHAFPVNDGLDGFSFQLFSFC